MWYCCDSRSKRDLRVDAYRAERKRREVEKEAERLKTELREIAKYASEMYPHIERGPGLAAVGIIARLAWSAIREEPDT